MQHWTRCYPDCWPGHWKIILRQSSVNWMVLPSYSQGSASECSWGFDAGLFVNHHAAGEIRIFSHSPLKDVSRWRVTRSAFQNAAADRREKIIFSWRFIPQNVKHVTQLLGQIRIVLRVLKKISRLYRSLNKECHINYKALPVDALKWEVCMNIITSHTILTVKIWSKLTSWK